MILFVVDPKVGNSSGAIEDYEAQALDEILSKMNIAVDKHYIKACPDFDRAFGEKEKKDYVKQNREEIIAAVNQYRPQAIVCLGKYAAQAVAGQKTRGKQAAKVILTDIVGVKYPVFITQSIADCLKFRDSLPEFYSSWKMFSNLKENGYDIDSYEESREGRFNARWCTDLEFILDNKYRFLGFDTETTGLKWYHSETQILTTQYAYSDKDAVVCPMNLDYYVKNKDYFEKRGVELDGQIINKLIKQQKFILENSAIKKAAHNKAFDILMVKGKYGIDVKGCDYDTYQLCWHIDENMLSHSLDECIRRFIPELSGYNDRLNREIDKKNMADTPPSKMLIYGGGDPIASFRLAKYAYKWLKENEPDQLYLYKTLYNPAIDMLYSDLTFNGIKIDTERLYSVEPVLGNKLLEMETKLLSQVPKIIKQKHILQGSDVYNALKLNRQDLLIDILFTVEGFNLTPVVFTKGSKNKAIKVPSTSSKTHLPYFTDIPFVAELMKYLALQKLLTSFIGKKEDKTGFWDLMDEHHYIHPSYNVGTVTGRLSSKGPNAQQFPNHGDYAKSFKEVIIP